jgi:pyrimidine operon attenuation protein/uracil phosphoribosyltransferase
MEGRKVLDAAGIETLVLRMSYQVEEHFFGYDSLAFVAIDGEGVALAKKMFAHLEERKAFELEFYVLSLPKHESSLPEMTFEPALALKKNTPVLLVDDVLNSGRTLFYALHPLLKVSIPSLRIGVLVERTYRHFPVSSSITGMQLSTTLEQNVVAKLTGKPEEIGVYLV